MRVRMRGQEKVCGILRTRVDERSIGVSERENKIGSQIEIEYGCVREKNVRVRVSRGWGT